MKNLLSLIILLLIPVIMAKASHLQGGEITWRCDGNGNYIFTLKLYRDCNGIVAPSSVNIQTNCPSTTGNIPCTLVDTIDLNPVGLNCPTCSIPNGNFFSVQQFIYESTPIAITPPNMGSYFIFYYMDCCRPILINNLSSSGGGNFIIYSKMYGTSFNSANTCNDNSAYFPEPPTLSLCTNDTNYYMHFAVDPDLDSIQYSWTPATQTIDINYTITNYPYNTGYSYNAPFPNPVHNPMNTGATLDSAHGMIRFYSNNIEPILTAIKVKSYRCGQLISEVNRESILSIVNCSASGSIPPQVNHKPEYANLPAVESLNLEPNDTLVKIILTYDNDSNSFYPDTITLSIESAQLGLNDTSVSTGCLVPPCAVLSQASPSVSAGLNFNAIFWNINCQHAGFYKNCLQHRRTYSFSIKSHDNFCPSNGTNYRSLLVHVSGPELIVNGSQLSLNSSYDTYQWYLNGMPIPGATDSVYSINGYGVYSVVVGDSAGTCTLLSNSHNVLGTDIAENRPEPGFSLYPNPTGSQQRLSLYFENFDRGEYRMDIIDVMGKLIETYSIHLSSEKEHLLVSLPECKPGVYQVRIATGTRALSRTMVVGR